MPDSNGDSSVTTDASSNASGVIPLVSVVDFHHARGPEVEKWFGVEGGHAGGVSSSVCSGIWGGVGVGMYGHKMRRGKKGRDKVVVRSVE